MKTFSNGKDLVAYMRTYTKEYVKVAWVDMLNECGKNMKESLTNLAGPTRDKDWAPLAPSTIDKKERMGWGYNEDPTTPWFEQGDFVNSLQIETNIAGKTVAVGTDLKQVKYLEYGTWHIPPRPIFKNAAFNVLQKNLKSTGITMHEALTK